MKEKKYEILEGSIKLIGLHTFYKIRALKNFGDIQKGQIGGYIEKEENLSHEGNCWIYSNAQVCDNAKISGDAMICENTKVFGNAKVFDCAVLGGNVIVDGNAEIFEYASLRENAHIHNYAKVFGNATIKGSSIIQSNAMVFGTSIIDGYTIFGKNAFIDDARKYLTIGPIGSRCDYTNFYLDKDHNIMVLCGCFTGTIDEFIDKVYKTHQRNELFISQYINTVNYVKSILK